MGVSATGLAALERFEADGFELDPVGDRIVMRGTLAMRDPVASVQPALLRLHEAVCEGGLREVRLDLRELRFVNSSALRLFFAWTGWIQEEPPERRYRIVIQLDRAVGWQRLSLPTIRGLAPDIFQLTS
jgi:hypothetical protein